VSGGHGQGGSGRPEPHGSDSGSGFGSVPEREPGSPVPGRVRRARTRLSALPLRSRLALLAALTVALAVAACATACWFLVRAQLVGSLDESLRKNNRVDSSFIVDQVRSGQCSPSRERAPNPFGATVQVVDRQGKSCVIVGRKVETSGSDAAVARGQQPESVHDARPTGGGDDFRVLTTPVAGTDVAVSVARPLTELDNSLRNLALVLALVGGAGVLGAAGAGVALARAGLRPVDGLTDAVEHIARTEDLAVRIPVEGDDEIARLSRSFNAMTGALASSRELQQQLIADAGHELRTPLTSLRTNIELLTRSEETGRSLPPEDRRALLSSVTAQLAELAALVGDLQELSRPDAAPGSAPVGVLALHDVVERAVERVRLRSSGVPLAVRLSPWYVRGDAAALERAVVNVLDNAVKFSPRGGEPVEVVLEGAAGPSAGGGASDAALAAGTAGPPGAAGASGAAGAGTAAAGTGVLRVRDHGPGVPPDELPYVFDRFWRSPSARSLPGSGLGLSIVARTVHQAGGEVVLRPPQSGGAGTEAVLWLPGAPTPPPSEPPAAQPGPAAPPGPPGSPDPSGPVNSPAQPPSSESGPQRS